MIIWLASYPKSGNTWLRAFITSLLYQSTKSNPLEDIDNIRAYPLTENFYNLLDNFNDFKQIAKNWELSQDVLNLDKKIRILKTHHSLCKINNYSFTNYKNSLGVIYIVRDPRNVITSLMHHYSLKNYSNTLKFILDKNRFSGRLGKKEGFERSTEFPTYISDWKNHYNSWKSFKKKNLLIKYEDLINNPKKTFKEVANFLSELVNVKLSNKKIEEAILKSSFNNLQKSEKKFGFREAPPDENTNKKKKFFNLGPQNKWEEFLPEEIRKKIEKEFYREMVELGYLN